MPTDTERRLVMLERALIAGVAGGTGLIAGTELQRFAPRLAPRAKPVGRLGVNLLKRVIPKSPIGRAAVIAYVAHTQGVGLDTAQDLIENELSEVEEGTRFTRQLLTPIQIASAIKDRKRRLSMANKAVKYGMGVLKAGGKAATGAAKGKLPKGAFKIATVAAGLANPNTPSRVKKGVSKVNKLARKIRSWWK